MKLEGKVVIAQGGGPTAVINQSLVGVTLEARKFQQVTRVYGALYGVQGIVNEQFIDLTQETTHNLEQVANTPSSALLSTRDKPDEQYCREIFRVLKAHGVRYFFYIGGNDSADTVRIVNEEADQADYEFRAIHIPKTIDNDLVLSDHTPGYGSAARFVASAFTGVNLDNRALPGVYIGVVMGRHAGFLTAAAALAQKYPDDGPHLIYMPERPFRQENFLDDVKRVYDQYGRCVVAVSEGIVDEHGTPVMTILTKNSETDAHGNVQLSGTGMLGDLLSDLVKEKLKIKRVRSDTFGYLQRSFVGCVSDVDQREAREVGERAAHYAIWYNLDGSISIQRTGFYSVNYQLEKLADVARKTRHMPDEYINSSGNGVTDEFKYYLRPLLGSGFGVAHRLRAPRVANLLKGNA
ncbi:MAG TPA: 6-phosphofructokinase [Candidatus Syntrophosphaera sp.]|jgi:6-phosphofructokinase 1|nr:6-phosphofructokinase [Candidatus Cloacimonadota bacterium]HOR03081.1 6-phosphofructokinase [Candidatus Syntrophosphaera sp.]HOG31677.1 6-phosphofructokinase [Candidatus Cloacimonadota bacterium]HPB44049.1 6-phosphofructokinase [Candidatus Syntrophosphaera sp.]HPK82894.1 6-phosphofructokinase [Candidatus Syntrophosphaera sp.]